MRYKTLLTTCAVFSVFSLTAQKSQNKAFAITGSTRGSLEWANVQMIDLNTGEVLQSIFDNKNSTYTAFNARSGKAIQLKDAKGNITDQTRQPFSSFSAALAYDQKHNRLYYTPMFINELRYIDLNGNSPRIYYFEGEQFSHATNLNDPAANITRMAIASDGNGYGLSNDGNHLVRFTTGRTPVISDLGALTDDANNGSNSVHAIQTSWGGDMVADASGNLFVITAYHWIFKVSIASKVAVYLGQIQGLPPSFTTNGAVVDNDGNLVVGSANSVDGYYSVDMKSWQATKMVSQGQVYNASDLANGNLAFTPKAQAVNLITRDETRDNRIMLYPNPVTTGLVNISFNNKETGRYDIQLVDELGRMISKKTVDIAYKGQIEAMPVSSRLARGSYLVKVVSSNQKTVFADKIIVQ
jgi:hypothetical protein